MLYFILLTFEDVPEVQLILLQISNMKSYAKPLNIFENRSILDVSGSYRYGPLYTFLCVIKLTRLERHIRN